MPRLIDQTLWLCSRVSLIPLLDSGPFVYCKKKEVGG